MIQTKDTESVTRESLEEWRVQLENMPWSHGDPVLAWEHIGQQHDAAVDENERNETVSLSWLVYVANAFADHILADRPWGNGAWEEYVGRAREWHIGYQTVDPRVVGNRPMVSFEHPGVETSLNNLTVKPVTNSHRLADAATEMGNSLAYWTELCATGRSLIYTIHSEGNEEIQAAMEVTRDGESWKVQQVEGPL